MDPVAAVADLAAWSPWTPFVDVVSLAPREPGVYLARQGDDVIYIGMAGLRDGDGKTSVKGLQGRLAYYAGGKGVATGLGEAAFARAIADADWLRKRLAEVEAGRPRSLREWGKAALERFDLRLCWTTTTDRESAVVLERQVIDRLRDGGRLWNQRV